MACPLSNLANNLSEVIYKIKCKNGHDNQNCETCAITYEVCDCFFENTNFKDDIIEFKYLCCNKNFQQKFYEKLKERFFNTNKFSNHGINNFILFLQQGVYLYKYKDDWEKFNETSLDEKKIFIFT